MGANQELQQIFDQLASGLEILGSDSFKANSHRRVARLLRDLTMDLRAFVEKDRTTAERRLMELPGIGKGAARRILEYLEQGELAEHQALLREVPVGVFDLLAIPGIGPKGAKRLWQELGVESVADLRRRLDDPALELLPGIGEKTIENLRQAIAFQAKTSARLPIGVARPIAESLVERLRREVPGCRIESCGSLRRGRETIGDLDFLATCRQPGKLADAFVGLPEVQKVLAHGDTRCSVRLEVGGVTVQADLRIVPAAAWGAALLYFTGSKEHNVKLREIAVHQDKHLNEYGLFRGTEERPHDRGERALAASTERAIYHKLGLPYVPPELREDRGESDGVPAHLVEVRHIGSELHAHTTASDGKLDLRSLVALVRERGYHTLAITDHSPASGLANGLDPRRLRRHVAAIRRLAAILDGFTLLAGAEVDILPDGRLDYPDELLAELDLVVASPHLSLGQDRATATRRLVRAVSHPLVDILGHPTGRIVGKRAGLDPDIDELCAAAAAHDVALEINANPRRLDLRDTHVLAARRHGCLIAIDTDVHAPPDLDTLVYGVLTARRGFLERSSCINCWPADRLRRWLRDRRTRHG